MSATEIQQYGGWDMGIVEAQEQQVEEGGGGGKADFLKLVVGRNTVRFLPPLTGPSPLVVTSQHFIERPAGKVVFVCPRVMAGQPCPACQKAEQLKATGKPADREAAGALFARQRIFANVIDRAHPEKGPVVFGFGKTVFEQLISLRKDPDVGDFTRPGPDGFDIIIDRKGTTKNDTEYTVRPSVKNCALGDLGVIQMQHDLSSYSRVDSWDDIVARLKGEKRPQGGSQGAAQALPATAGAVAPWDAQPAAPGGAQPGAAVDPKFGF